MDSYKLDAHVLRRLEAAHTWHPFAQMREYLAVPPLFIERGKGVWLYDTDGRKYLDANSSLWTNVHGHNDPELNAALRKQLGRVAHATWLGLSHPNATALAAALTRAAPKGLTRVFFSDNGSNAIEIALKQSWQYWQQAGLPQKTQIIGIEGGYHGDTLACMAAGDSGGFHGKFKRFFPAAWHCPRPNHSRLGKRAGVAASLNLLEARLKKYGDKTACLVMEPCLQGSSGMIFHPPSFVRGVARLCARYRVHLIFDEVFTGFGRMGHIFLCRKLDISPDFLCLGKGLGGGYLTLAATLAHERLYRAFWGRAEDENAFIHGHTFTANPLACAVALKSIEKLESMIAHGVLETRIRAFNTQLKAVFGNHPHAAEVRCGGLAGAVDLVPDARTPQKKYPPSSRAGLQVCLEARKRGLILRPLGDTLLFVPSPAMSPNEQKTMLRLARESVSAALDSAAEPARDFYDYARRFRETPAPVRTAKGSRTAHAWRSKLKTPSK